LNAASSCSSPDPTGGLPPSERRASLPTACHPPQPHLPLHCLVPLV
jgi:hypothetical protein